MTARIDGKDYDIIEGETILDIARRNDIYIPTLHNSWTVLGILTPEETGAAFSTARALTSYLRGNRFGVFHSQGNKILCPRRPVRRFP